MKLRSSVRSLGQSGVCFPLVKGVSAPEQKVYLLEILKNRRLEVEGGLSGERDIEDELRSFDPNSPPRQ